RYYLEKADNGTMNLLRFESIKTDPMEIEREKGDLIATGILKWNLELYDPRNDQWRKDWDVKGRLTSNYFPMAARISFDVINPEIPKEQWNERSLRFQTAVLLLNQVEEGG